MKSDTFQENTRAIRLALGLRQEDAAKKAKIPRERWTRIEGASSNPTLKTIQTVASVLGVRPSDLINPDFLKTRK